MIRRNAFCLVSLVVLGALLTACGGEDPTTDADTGPPGDAQPDSTGDTNPPLPDGLPPGEGSCTPPCSAGKICRNDRCYSACQNSDDCIPGLECCHNACVDFAQDVNHCTGCDNPCVPHADRCRNGRCECAGNGGDACQPPFHCCGGSGCIDVENNPDHCGRCYQPCPGDCIDGHCHTCYEDEQDRQGVGNDLADAEDLGEIRDAPDDLNVRGNLYPDGDQDCFRFKAIDLTALDERLTCGSSNRANTIGDRFHVDIRFTTNPTGQFALRVYRGGPMGGQCVGESYHSYSWGTAFSDTSNDPPIGQCPCHRDSVATPQSVKCTDDTADFLFCVVLAPGRANSCVNYEIQVSNGLYPTEID